MYAFNSRSCINSFFLLKQKKSLFSSLNMWHFVFVLFLSEGMNNSTNRVTHTHFYFRPIEPKVTCLVIHPWRNRQLVPGIFASTKFVVYFTYNSISTLPTFLSDLPLTFQSNILINLYSPFPLVVITPWFLFIFRRKKNSCCEDQFIFPTFFVCFCFSPLHIQYIYFTENCQTHNRQNWQLCGNFFFLFSYHHTGNSWKQTHRLFIVWLYDCMWQIYGWCDVVYYMDDNQPFDIYPWNINKKRKNISYTASHISFLLIKVKYLSYSILCRWKDSVETLWECSKSALQICLIQMPHISNPQIQPTYHSKY